DRTKVRELLGEQIRHRLPLDLVGIEQLMPVHRPGVPGYGDALRPVVRKQLEQHVREAEQSVRREALACRELLGEREESAIGEVVSVDEKELGIADRRVVELQLLAGQSLGTHSPKLSSRTDVRDRNRAAGRRPPRRCSGAPGPPPCAPPGYGAAAAGGLRLPCSARTRSGSRAG